MAFSFDNYIAQYFTQYELQSSMETSSLVQSFSMPRPLKYMIIPTHRTDLDLPIHFIRRSDRVRRCFVTHEWPVFVPLNKTALHIKTENLFVDEDIFQNCNLHHITHLCLHTSLNTRMLPMINLRTIDCDYYILYEHDRLVSIVCKTIFLTQIATNLRYIRCHRIMTDVQIHKTSVDFLDIHYTPELTELAHNVRCLTIRRIHSKVIHFIPPRVEFLRLVGVNIRVKEEIKNQCKIFICGSKDKIAKTDYKFWLEDHKN